MKEYCELASKTANEQKEYFTGPLGNDVFQCTPMPWVTYTQIPARRIMQHLFLTGENIIKKMEKL